MATDLPANVAGGELITSAWGNLVADELERLRTQAWADFVHNGGTTSTAGAYDCGTTTLGPFAYTVRVTVIATFQYGFNGVAAVSGTPSIIRLSDSGGAAALGQSWAQAGFWAQVPLQHSYQIAAGTAAGFKTNITLGFPNTGTTYFAARGVYHVQRVDIA